MNSITFKNRTELTNFVNSNIETRVVAITESHDSNVGEFTLFYKSAMDGKSTIESKNVIFINEQHSLKAEQSEILDSHFPDGYETIKIPANGWKLAEMKKIVMENRRNRIVMVSPVPFMIMNFQYRISQDRMTALHETDGYYAPDASISVFHNDNRDKKELPNGKIITTPAEKGWQLV